MVQGSRSAAEAGGAKSGQGRGGEGVPVRPSAGTFTPGRGGGGQRSSARNKLSENPWTPSSSLAGSTACSRGKQRQVDSKGHQVDRDAQDDLSKVPHSAEALTKWVKDKFGPRAGAHVSALVEYARRLGAAEGQSIAQAEHDKAEKERAGLEKVVEDELEKQLAQLEEEMEESDTEQIRVLKAHVQTLTSELALRQTVANDAQPAAASSSGEAQLAAAVAQLEGAFTTIKAQAAAISAHKADIQARKAGKKLAFNLRREDARDTEETFGRIEQDARARRLRAAAVAAQRSPESSVSPESVAASFSPATHVVRTSHSLSLTPTHSLTLSHSHSLLLALTHSHLLSLTPTLPFTLTHSHSLSLSLTLTHSHSLSLTLTHSHSHTLS